MRYFLASALTMLVFASPAFATECETPDGIQYVFGDNEYVVFARGSGNPLPASVVTPENVTLMLKGGKASVLGVRTTYPGKCRTFLLQKGLAGAEMTGDQPE